MEQFDDVDSDHGIRITTRKKLERNSPNTFELGSYSLTTWTLTKALELEQKKVRKKQSEYHWAEQLLWLWTWHKGKDDVKSYKESILIFKLGSCCDTVAQITA